MDKETCVIKGLWDDKARLRTDRGLLRAKIAGRAK